MNTRNAYALRARQYGRAPGPYGLGTPEAVLPGRPVQASPEQSLPHPACSTLPERVCRHPLADRAANERLAMAEEATKARFDIIVPVLMKIAALPSGPDFVERAQEIATAELGERLPETVLENAWISGLDVKALYGYAVFSALKAGAAQFAEDLRNQVESVQDTRNFFLDCGFHAVNISPCADGRLKGLMRYILRLPLTSFTRRTAYAGAMFDVEDDVRHWVATELRRFREGVPTTADSGTRYLKVAVYHTSSSDPSHEGCAAHGSNEHRAIDAALQRLLEFRQAIENAFCCGASTDILLIGVDTDIDAIRVHVPDAKGNLSAYRFVDNAALYAQTLNLSADAARLAIYDAIRTAGQKGGWSQGEGEPHEGMRKLVANLLINNLSQIEYVAEFFGGRYPDVGHAERYLSVGDGFEEVQVRNLAYYAHLDTLEEGAPDMDVGIKIFKKTNVVRGLPIPIAIHYRYDARVPGSRNRVIAKGQRVREAIAERYKELETRGCLMCHLSVQDLPAGSPIEEVA